MQLFNKETMNDSERTRAIKSMKAEQKRLGMTLMLGNGIPFGIFILCIPLLLIGMAFNLTNEFAANVGFLLVIDFVLGGCIAAITTVGVLKKLARIYSETFLFFYNQVFVLFIGLIMVSIAMIVAPVAFILGLILYRDEYLERELEAEKDPEKCKANVLKTMKDTFDSHIKFYIVVGASFGMTVLANILLNVIPQSAGAWIVVAGIYVLISMVSEGFLWVFGAKMFMKSFAYYECVCDTDVVDDKAVFMYALKKTLFGCLTLGILTTINSKKKYKELMAMDAFDAIGAGQA